MNLFDFTYCGNYNRHIQNLSRMVPEKWSFGENEDRGILKGYLEHTFQRVYEEGKVLEEDSYTIFNTGLFNYYYQPVYAFFVKNLVPDRQRVVSGRVLHRVLFIKIRNRQSSGEGGICKKSCGSCV